MPAADLAALGQGAQTITASVNDRAGNPGQTTHALTVDTVAPTVTIATVAGDDIINNAEQLAGQTISGTTTAEVGQTVTVTFNGQTWTATVGSGGSWSVFIPAQQFAGLSDGSYTISATVSDQAGNPGSASRGVTLNGDVPSVTINTFAGNDVVNAAEHGSSLVISGTTTAPVGQTLTLTLNGKTYTTTVQTGGSWSYTLGSADVTALADGNAYVINASVSNAIGNTGSSNHTITVDLSAPAMGINIDSLQADTGLSASDFITSVSPVVVNGSLTAALASNETAQISIDGGVTWTTLTTNGTQWTYTDGRTLTDGSYVYQVRVLDLAGNTGPVVVDTINPTATPTIVSYTDDVGQRQGTLSSSQATDDTTPLLNGVLSGPLASGEVVYLYRNGLLLGAVTMVGALNWTYSDSGLVSGAYTYSARVVDLAGNITASSDFVLTVDTSIPTTLAQITSQTTRDTTPIISGVITVALASGQYVEVVINGKTYTSEPGGAVVVDPAHNTWYVQLPDTDALTVSATAYTVTAQVKSSAGNGNNANISNGTVTVNAAIDYTPTWTTTSKTTAWGLTYGLDSHGMWTVLANQQVMQSTDPLTWSKTALTLYQSGNNYATSSIADYDRNGTGDLFITRDDYGTGYINGFTNNGDGTFSSAIQVTVGTLTWYGSIVAFDKEGDGYLDFWIGDAGGPDSNTFLWNNAGTLVGNSTTSNSGGSATVGGAVTGYLSLNEGSGVDLNNDGRIDLVQHTYNLNNYYTLSSLINQGNGTFVWGQNTINTFLSTAGSGGNSTSVSMTWADFDGDGDMDLFLPAREELTTAPCYSTPTACWAVRWGGGYGNHLRQPV